MIDELYKKQPKLLLECESALMDKGYDDKKLYEKLWDVYKIKPVIDIRNMWKDSDETRILEKYPNVVYDYQGGVYCYPRLSSDKVPMAFGGFERKRNTLKYRCPAKQYGIECPIKAYCSARNGIRIALSTDRRIFTPLARSSYNEKKSIISVPRWNG